MIIHHGLNAFFELTTIFRPGYHQRKIDGPMPKICRTARSVGLKQGRSASLPSALRKEIPSIALGGRTGIQVDHFGNALKREADL
jgi:hypothetical protein